MIYARKTVFACERTVPAIFTDPVNAGDTLVYNANSGVFTNEAFASAITINNTGAGGRLITLAGNVMNVKGITGGTNISVNDTGTEIVINSTSPYIAANLAELDVIVPATGAFGFVLDIGVGIPGLYIYNGTSWVPTASLNPSQQLMMVHVPFEHTSTSPVAIITLPAEAVISSTELTVFEAFDGIGATVTVGTVAEHDLLLDTSETDLTQVKTFSDSNTFILPNTGSQVIGIYLNSSSSTVGSGIVFITYSLT